MKLVSILMALLSLNVLATELPLKEVAVASLRVQPKLILLDHQEDFQSIIAQAFYEDEKSKDVLNQIEVEIVDPSICSYEEGVFYPTKNGKTNAIIRFQGKESQIAVECKNSTEKEELSFALHVMPIFTKAGCNTGGCHGASRGQDNFRLSLFGFDPKGDRHRLLDEFPGRRVNLAVPEDSMLLTKAIKAVPHTGGQLFDKQSNEYKVLLKWLKQGAPEDKKDLKKAVRLEFFPANSVINQGGQQTVSVRVVYSDGSDADISALCSFISSDDSLATIDGKVLQTKKTGEAFMMARFGTLTALTQVISLTHNSGAIEGIKEVNYIDQLSNKKWRELRLPPSGGCSDEVFLRRVYLDVVGGLPSESEYKSFMNDTHLDKRARLVDDLLKRPEFTDIWIMKWAELLQIRSFREFSYKNTLIYFDWLKKRVKEGVPIDKIVYDLLTSSGHSFENPASNFYKIEKDVLKRSENIAQVFMGRQIQCAQCHNHPFDRWSMNDYYGFAAFFAQIGSKIAEDPRAEIIYDKRSGGVNHPVLKKALEPVFLGGEKADVKGRDRREVFAEWLLAKENPYFAKNIANRVWEHFLGRGIIHPVDDARLSNPASNGPLLDALGQRLIGYKFDLKQLVRDICLSNVYQRSSQSLAQNASDIKNFSHAGIRRIRAEVLLDTINQVTQTKDKFKALPTGAKAVEIADGNSGSYFLTTFGRASRETACACEVSVEPNLSQALHLLNGDTVNKKIVSGGLIRNWLKEKLSVAEIIEKLYVICYTRKPSANESDALVAKIVEGKNYQEGLEDVFWALLNSKEFLFVR
jgi:hypothetical protein